MRILLLLILGSFLICASSSFASQTITGGNSHSAVLAESNSDASDSGTKKTEKKAIPNAKTKKTVRSSSPNPRFSLGLRAGLIVNTIGGGGGEFFFPQSKDLHYGVTLMIGSSDQSGKIGDNDSAKISTYEVSANLILAGLRYFMWDTLYAYGGIGMRSLNTSYEVSGTSSSDKVSGDVNGSSVIAHLSVGNLWVWDSGLFVGADWVGYSVPLSSSYAKTVDQEAVVGSDTKKLQEAVESAGMTASQGGSYQVLVLNAGYLF